MKKNILIVGLFFLIGCAGPGVFVSSGSGMANPLTLAIDSTAARLYVNNSNNKVGFSDGSLHVVDITNPASPVRVNYSNVPSFASQIYLDPASKILYTPDRQGEPLKNYVLFRFNVDEAAAGFLSRSDYVSGENPYGIACCDAAGRMYVASEGGQLDYYDVNNSMAHSSLSLTTTLDTGASFTGLGAKRVVIIGTQAVVVRLYGGIWIINLDEIGVSGANPIDYFVTDFSYPRGIAADATNVYLADTEYPGNVDTPYLYVLDLTPLPPVTGDTTTRLIYKDDVGMVAAEIPLTTTDPQELVITGTSTQAFVTHLVHNAVSVVDLVARQKTATVTVGTEPFGMAVYSPGGVPTHLFVANNGGNNVSVIDIVNNNTVVGTYP